MRTLNITLILVVQIDDTVGVPVMGAPLEVLGVYKLENNPPRFTGWSCAIITLLETSKKYN